MMRLKRLVLPAVVVLAVGLVGLVVFFRSSPGTSTMLWNWSNGGTWLLPLLAVSAIIDSINPCAFSVLLVTIAFLLSIGKLRTKILTIGSAYILGLFLAYLSIGLGLLSALHLFSTPHFMAKVGATAMIVLGVINIINELFPKFPIKLRIPMAAHHRMAELMEAASIPTALGLGALVGLCEFPCTGGPYLMAVGLLHDRATYLQGFGYLLLYNVLFVLPLVLILVAATDSHVVSHLERWQQSGKGIMRWAGGVVMVFLGLIIFWL